MRRLQPHCVTVLYAKARRSTASGISVACTRFCRHTAKLHLLKGNTRFRMSVSKLVSELATP